MVKLFHRLAFIKDIVSSHMTERNVIQWPQHFRLYLTFVICMVFSSPDLKGYVSYCHHSVPKGLCQLLPSLCTYRNMSAIAITLCLLTIVQPSIVVVNISHFDHIKLLGQLEPIFAEIMFMRSSTNIHHYVFIH